MEEYLKILGGVIPLFLLIAAGAVVRQCRILNEEADRTILDLNVNFLFPCLVLDHVVANDALRQTGNLLWSPTLGFACTAACFGVAMFAARLYKFKPEARARTFGFAAGIFNYGYIPVPLIMTLYGAKALGVLFLFNLGTEVAFWTIGFGWTLAGHSPFSDWRRALTMPVRAIILAVAINLVTGSFGILLDDATLTATFHGWPVHWWGLPVKVLMDAVHLAGICSIPLALLLIGATMADFWGKFHVAHGLGVMALGVLVRNLICPLGFVLLACTLPISKELQETLVVQAAMPAGMLTLVLARHYDGDVPVALQVIYATSAVAIVTLPLWIHFGMQLVGVK